MKVKLYEEIKKMVEWKARFDSRVGQIEEDLIQELYLSISPNVDNATPESHRRQMIKTRILSVGERLFSQLYEREAIGTEIGLLELSDETIRWGLGVRRSYLPDWPVRWEVTDDFERMLRSRLWETLAERKLLENPDEENFKQALLKDHSPIQSTLILEVCRSLSKKTSPLVYTQATLSNSGNVKKNILDQYEILRNSRVADGVCTFEDGVWLCDDYGVSFRRALEKRNTLYFDGPCPLCQSKAKRLFLSWRETLNGYKWNSNCYKCRCKSLRFKDGSRTHSCIERFLAMALV